MSKNNQITRLYLCIVGGGLGCSFLLIGCNQGSNQPSTTAITTGNKSSVHASMPQNVSAPQQSKSISNNQQSFSVTTTPVTLSSIRVKFFSNNRCDSESGVIKIVTLGSVGDATFSAGTYSGSSLSSYSICSQYNPGGCVGLYNDYMQGKVQSMQYVYTYAAASGGPGIVLGDCMAGGRASSKEALLNWSNPSSPVACDPNNCGYSRAYNTVLPSKIYASFLAAPKEGNTSSVNTGITWGSGGLVNPRFVVAKDIKGNPCPAGQEVESDALTGLSWIKSPTSNQYTWANAQLSSAIPSLYCGYNDWRLPTINELMSLVNYSAANNLVGWLTSQGFNNVKKGIYWSATAAGANNAFALDFNDLSGVFDAGSSAPFPITVPSYVWPVRGGKQ